MSTAIAKNEEPIAAPHPRTIGWIGTTALAMGGSNQMVFLIGALIAGQGAIPGQGSAAVLCLIAGLVLGWMAMPGWTELILMWPNRVGGIAATCGEAFRPYAPVLGNITGVAYWWGWVPTCGLCALLSAGAIHSWFLPSVPVSAVASGLVLFFMTVNLCGVKWITRLTIPIALISATLAFLSAVVPVWSGTVDWHRAMSFQLTVPFPGLFGKVTSFMAGLYLVGFAAPAFEAAACHVGETVNQNKDVPRAMFAAAVMATLYFLILPVIWLGAIGSDSMAGDLAETLGPTFAPLLGGGAKAAAIGFLVFNMFHGTIAPMAGVCRTLSQLAEDGLMPRFFGKRIKRTDAPWVATTFTAACAIVFLLMGDPVWLIAAANFTYLIGISLPSVAVWLLRRDEPKMHRPYRAPRGTIWAGMIAAIIWGISTILGFEQFGLPTVIFGLFLAYSGAILYAWRKWDDHRRAGHKGIPGSLHVKLTGAMLLVLLLDGAGYLMAVKNAGDHGTALIAVLEDIFVAVALLTINVGLILPGMIANSAVEVAKAARRLATGTLADFSRAMEALSSGNLDAAHARVDIVPVVVHTRDELGHMATSFNTMQEEVGRAAAGLDGAREGLRQARKELEEINASLEQRVVERTTELESAHKKLVDAAWHAGMAEVAIGVLHNVGNVLNSVNVSATLVDGKLRKSTAAAGLSKVSDLLREHRDDLGTFVSSDERGKQLPGYLLKLAEHFQLEQQEVLEELAALSTNVEHVKQIVSTQQSYARVSGMTEAVDLKELMEDAIRINFAAEHHGVQIDRRYDQHLGLLTVDKHKVLQILVNLLKNAKDAINERGHSEKNLILEVGCHPQDRARLILRVTDDGVGIQPQHMPRIFEHGFTTKKNGHGFGLHSSSLAAKAMGGTIRAHSEGRDRGAVFTLELVAAARALAA
jgi:amino acid transporter/signal transduction histidine kinase